MQDQSIINVNSLVLSSGLATMLNCGAAIVAPPQVIDTFLIGILINWNSLILNSVRVFLLRGIRLLFTLPHPGRSHSRHPSLCIGHLTCR